MNTRELFSKLESTFSWLVTEYETLSDFGIEYSHLCACLYSGLRLYTLRKIHRVSKAGGKAQKDVLLI